MTVAVSISVALIVMPEVGVTVHVGGETVAVRVRVTSARLVGLVAMTVGEDKLLTAQAVNQAKGNWTQKNCG